MNSVLPKLEQDLLDAADRRLAERRGSEPRHSGRSLARRRLADLQRRGRLSARWLLLTLAGLLATTTIALAAGGVILAGKGNPRVGYGVPIEGTVRLLALRVPDPEGGPPWGMRVLRTTRGYTCLQIGRVEHGQLGTLGIDGAFHDDGSFHRRPLGRLPSASPLQLEDVCKLTGTAFTGDDLDEDRNAVAGFEHARQPLSHVREVYYGLLGKEGVSVSYKAGGKAHTSEVIPGLGAYLIVTPATTREQASGQATGSEGGLAPSPPLSAITYRIDGRLCERGPFEPRGHASHVAHPCAPLHYRRSPRRKPRNLHKPLHVRLITHGHRITAAIVSFTAPFAVTSGRENYSIQIPGTACRSTTGGIGFTAESIEAMDSLNRDVARGAKLTERLSWHPKFEGACGHGHTDRATIEVLYERVGEPGGQIAVGTATVHRPRARR